MQQLLTPRQLAEAIGVSEASIRRWADSGQIKVARTAGGHRKIARAEALRFIRSTSANIVRPDLLDVAEPNHRHHRSEAFTAQHDELLAALESGQAELASGLLTRMHLHGASVAEICDGPLRYALRCIGEKWPDDKRGILVEHRATNICIESLNRLRSRLPQASPTAPVAVGGAPATDPYILPSLMVTATLAEVGFQPINLGPNTPLEIVAESAIEMDARLIWISITAAPPKNPVEKRLRKLLRRLQKSGAQVVIGGRKSHRLTLPTSGRVRTFPSLSELAGFAKGLLN